MSPLERLIEEKFKTDFEHFQYKAIKENAEELVKYSLSHGNRDVVIESVLSYLVTSMLIMHSKLDGISDGALKEFHEKNGFKLPPVEIIEAPEEVELNLFDPIVPAGLGRLERSASSSLPFRWLLADAPFVANFRIKNTGRIKVSLHYLSFAEGVSARDLDIKVHGVPVVMRVVSDHLLEGVVEFDEAFLPDLVTMRMTSDSYCAAGDRNLVMSVASLKLTSIDLSH